MKVFSVVYLTLLASSLLFPMRSNAQDQATLVLIHGKIRTESPKQPEVEAIGIWGNRIVALGDSAAILKLAGPDTKVIDLHWRRVVPGFDDAHVHFYMGGDALTSVQLRAASSPQEFRKIVADFAQTAPKGEWLLNGNWDHERWTPPALPTHELIDDVTPNNPVFVNRSDGHICLANTVAMKLAGVDKNTPDIPGGVIVRDKEGNPTGVF